MAIETEIKLRVDDLEGLRRRLESLRGVLRAARHFEDNYVFDFPDGSTRSRGCLVRIRNAGPKWLLTYKGPALEAGPFKTREELETELGDGRAALEFLCRIGMLLWFRYQKYREEYGVALDGPPEDEVTVALDETPVGSFAELEGSETGIRRVARALGYGDGDFIRDSYYMLYARACRERGESVSHMVFSSRG